MTLVFMAALNWRLALTTFVVVPAIVLLSRAMGSFTSRMARASQDALAEANSTAEEVISALATVRAFSGEAGDRRRFSAGASLTEWMACALFHQCQDPMMVGGTRLWVLCDALQCRISLAGPSLGGGVVHSLRANRHAATFLRFATAASARARCFDQLLKGARIVPTRLTFSDSPDSTTLFGDT